MTPSLFSLPEKRTWSLWQKVLMGLGLTLLAVLLVLLVMRLAYHDRLYPGTKAYGIYVGGLTRQQAVDLLTKETSKYVDSSTIIVNGPGIQPLPIPASEVELQYDTQGAVDSLYQLGHDGGLMNGLATQAKLLIGGQELPQGEVSYNTVKLVSSVQPAFAKLNTPAQNASFVVSKTGELTIQPEQLGQRVDLLGFLKHYEQSVSQLQRTATTLKTTNQAPAITAAALESKRQALAPFMQEPLTLTYGARSWKIPTSEMLSWLSYAALRGPEQPDILNHYYARFENSSTSNVSFDTLRIQNYLATIAKDVNQPARDAKLTISGERATVFQQSQDGRALDVTATTSAIAENFASPQPETTLALKVSVIKADVSDENLDRLGIKELLSEGVTYFPGSSANRLTNVRVGASKFNGVLLKPGEVFSFGALLGEVGPAQGYKEGHVILEGRQENQYGGGLCQVSSTAFRAALLAGLPILERYNHAFAVSFYTAPYGVPGVDATIYYPQVDFKFKNDTDNYILIQTEMQGTTLKFRYYGTKKKEGVLRGPTFIYGSNDPNQPSKTVFYRDIKVNGQVVKTDTFYTTYRSALDYPSAD